MYACTCREVTEQDVKVAGCQGIVAPTALITYFRLDDDEACGRCLEDIDLFADLAHEGIAAEQDDAPCAN